MTRKTVQQINLFNPAFQPQQKILSAATMALGLGVLVLGSAALAGFGALQTAELRQEAALGAKRVEMCDRTVAQRVTGYVLGGISPFGQRKRLPTVVDETCELYDVVYVSGGRRGLDLGVAPADLIGILDARTADISA